MTSMMDTVDVGQMTADYYAGVKLDTLCDKHRITIPAFNCWRRKAKIARVKPSKKRVLSPSELTNLIADYSRGDSFETLGGRYLISPYIINRHLREVGLLKRFQYTEDDIVKAYQEGLDIRQVAKRFHASPNTISPILVKRGVPFRDNKAYSINEHIFDTVDERLTYFLGLFCADGCIYQRRNQWRFSVTLHADDIALLEQLRAWMGTDRPLYKPRDSNCFDLCVTNKALCEAITRLGLGDKKYNRVHIPKAIPPELVRHFVRGAFDGDGTIRIGKLGQLSFSICGYEPFLRELLVVIGQQTGVSPHYRFVQFNSDGSRFGTIDVCGNRQAKVVFDWLYHDCVFKLARKHNRYLKHQSIYEAWKREGGLLRDRFNLGGTF